MKNLLFIGIDRLRLDVIRPGMRQSASDHAPDALHCAAQTVTMVRDEG